MHRLAVSAAGSSSTLCLPGLPSASVATNIAQDQQKHMEDAHGHAAANDLFPDGAQGSGDRLNPHRCQTSDLTRAQPGSVQSKSCTTRHSSTLKSKPCSVKDHVQKLVEIDSLTSVISAMEQSKYNELKVIYPPGTSPFKAPSDVAEMNEALQESLENDYV